MAASFTDLPYVQATPAQRQLALERARQVLDPAYPHLSWAQWVAALDQVQPLLWLLPGPVIQPAHEGLAALASYLAPLAAAAEQAAAAGPPAAPGQLVPEPAGPSGQRKKQTYAVPLDVCEQLANVQYWCRLSITRLVIDALRQYLGRFPEARRPRPDRDPPPPSA